MKHVDVAIAIVLRQESVLICRRRQDTRLAGYWEFPGGKVEPGETLEQCLARELLEELDIAAEPVAPLSVIEHDYGDIHVRLHPFLCAYQRGEPKPLGCSEFKWIEPAALRDYRFPPANDQLIEHLIDRLGPDPESSH